MERRRLELNGGLVSGDDALCLTLPPTDQGYADAQIDDYGPVKSRRQYAWRPGTLLSLSARFLFGPGPLLGTAGFGFWNAPFGDPTVPTPALPQAAWFFYASAPSDLPFALSGPSRGWFAATIDAGTARALLTAPLAPFLLLLNQAQRWRARTWPWIRRRLQISHAPLTCAMTEWHTYRLAWKCDGCVFSVDDEVVLQTPYSPRGPLGFVCWIDNQYMVATASGRFRWGVLRTSRQQQLEINELQLSAP